MEYLSYKAKNNLNLKDKPKIYFTSTRSDKEKYLEEVVKDIFDLADAIIYFKNDPATAKYGHIFEPNLYDVHFYDTTRTSGHTGAFIVEPTLPMIRLLVGPKTVGIEEVGQSLSVNLHPNSASGWVTVDVAGATGRVECILTDINGRQVYSTNAIAHSGNASIRLDVSSLPAGVYILRTRTADGLNNVQKLVVR